MAQFTEGFLDGWIFRLRGCNALPKIKIFIDFTSRGLGGIAENRIFKNYVPRHDIFMAGFKLGRTSWVVEDRADFRCTFRGEWEQQAILADEE